MTCENGAPVLAGNLFGVGKATELPLDLAWLAECDRRDEYRVWRETWPYSWFPPAPAKYSRNAHELPPPHPLLTITARARFRVVE